MSTPSCRSASARCAASSSCKLELMPDPARQRIELKISGGGFGSAVDMTAGADVVASGSASRRAEVERRSRGARTGGGRRRRVLDAQAHKLIAQAFANVRQELSNLNPSATRDAQGQSA